MQIASPLPAGLVALTLALPGVWLAGRRVARSIEGDPLIARIITPALSISLWLLPVHVLARASRSFSFGLIAGTLVVSLCGLIARLKEPGDARLRSGRALPAAAWIGAIAAMAIIAPSALEWAIHDEAWPIGHISIPAQMHNDFYPPRDVHFPDVELRYHYGFDLLTAVAAALSRAPISLVLDAITIACWGYTFLLLWTIGERVVGRHSGALVAFVTLFGGGAALLCGGSFPPRAGDFAGFCQVEKLTINPPLSSYFFQHPFTLGLPIAFAAILVAMDRRCRPARRYAVLGLLLVMLSLSQIVLFLTVTGALFAQEIFSGSWARSPSLSPLRSALRARIDVARAIPMVLLIAAVLVAARALGGFFLPPYDGSGSGLVVRLGITETPSGSLRWLAFTYGLLLPLGLIGVFLLRRERLFFMALLAGSFAVLCSFRFARTWDIVKFATVAAVPLSIGASAAIHRIFTRSPAALWKSAGALTLAGVTVTGLGFSLLFGLFPEKVPTNSAVVRRVQEFDRPNAEVVTWLRTHIARGDIAYRRDPAAYLYSVWGGLPSARIGVEAQFFGFSERRLAPRRWLMSQLPDDPDEYLTQSVRWLVLDPRDLVLQKHAERWIQEGRAHERARFGQLRILEILPGSGAEGAL